MAQTSFDIAPYSLVMSASNTRIASQNQSYGIYVIRNFMACNCGLLEDKVLFLSNIVHFMTLLQQIHMFTSTASLKRLTESPQTNE